MGSDSFDARDRAHVFIDLFRTSADYTPRSRPRSGKQRRDDHSAHSNRLLSQLDAALGDTPQAIVDLRLPIKGLKPGSIIEVDTTPPSSDERVQAVKLPANLEMPAQDLVILRSRRNVDRTESALVFIPDDMRDRLRARIADYGRRHNADDVQRFEVIENVLTPTGTSLFIGDVDLESPETLWWEVWVRQDDGRADQIAAAARNAYIDVHEDRLIFPETTVLFLHSSASALIAFVSRVPGAITEIRQATGTVDLFVDETENGFISHDWIADLVSRVTPPSNEAPVVCTLDTGISAAHPLVALGLRGAWAYDAAWGTDDHYQHGGHGTPLLGLVLYGDLEPLMNDNRTVELTHGAESMKLLPPRGFPPTKPPSYGVVTQGAVSSAEIERPNAVRTFCIACSSEDFPPDRPSSWSGALDQIASGSMPGESDGDVPASEREKRLLLVATGNVVEANLKDVLVSQPLEDPSQSWNALTIGGFTRKELLPAPCPGLQAVACANERSPYSRGSQSLPYDLTPIKPEVLFEAGNMVSDASGFCSSHPAVSLLAPGSDVVTQPLVPFWATSAAVGVAGNFAGQLQAALPDLWPETHRALIVDSARWPEPVRKRFIGRGAHWKTGSKTNKQELLREVGYGVPDINRAIWSAQNDATMIAQAEIQPFAYSPDRRTGVFNAMHLYGLPWPKATLERLENEPVLMRVTLSYFVEPNLAGKAATRPDTYRSFGLRFTMKKRTETDADFLRRVSASQSRGGSESINEPSYWLLGPNAIQAGSLHCDLWRGRAIELIEHDSLAVFPVGGWWKSHLGQKRVTDKARYALVISISAPGHNVDLYSEISALVEARSAEVLIT